MENRKIDISNLDFFSIKNSLISFLQTQSEFSGYSFEGSAMNVLIDLLSYNTYYNGFYNNFVMNETFLDSAVKRSSVVSLAKQLGYTPQSSKNSTAKVIIKQDADQYQEVKKIIRRNTRISSQNSVGNTVYFVTDSDYTLEPYELNDDSSINKYAAIDVTLVQGVYNSYSSIISIPLQKIILPFNNIDITTIKAYVLESVSDASGVTTEWKRAINITDTAADSKIFFVSENASGLYEIQFGDGVFGTQLKTGNVVLFEFLITSGSLGNEIGKLDNSVFSSFSLSGFEIETIQYASGGSDREQIGSIRRNALRNFSTQERAVTASDYEAMILKLFGSVESVRCWGGEDNDPPEFGKVFATVKPKNGAFLTASEKNNIINTLITNKGTVGVNIEIQDPDILYLNFSVNAKYDPTLTIDTETKIKEILSSSILSYSSINYKGFDDDFFASDFIENVIKFHNSLVSLSVVPIMEKRIYPRLGVKEYYTINFGNELSMNYSVSTPGFYSLITEQGSIISKLCYIEEDSTTLKLYYLDVQGNKIYSGDVGTVDHTNGIVTLNVTISELPEGFIAILATPKDVDVFTGKETTLSIDTVSNRNIAIDLKKAYRNTTQNVSSSNR